MSAQEAAQIFNVPKSSLRGMLTGIKKKSEMKEN
jgi:hypothetical protein